MPHNLLEYSNEGEPVGINILAIKDWVAKTTPNHLDVQPYLLVHYRAKYQYLEELSRQTVPWQLVIWTAGVVKALGYLEKLIDTILETDETHYLCDLRNHQQGETCPNRVHLILPEPDN